MLELEFKVGKTGTVDVPAGEIIYCLPRQLHLHPHNMRRFYPANDVHKMRDSIRAARGVYQAMLVVPDPENPGGFLVVDGNMRLAGGRALGKACPPLKCEVITADHAQQLLIMAATSTHHFPKDPISEGLHYRRLREEGFTMQAIADAIGCHVRTIEARLKLLELDEPVQKLVATGRLTKDMRFAEALIAIPDRAARVKLAQQLAAKRAGLKVGVAACKRLSSAIAPPPKKQAGPKIQDVKIYSHLAGQTLGWFSKDAKLLEAAALALPPDECELSAQLAERAEALRGIIDRVIKRGETLKQK